MWSKPGKDRSPSASPQLLAKRKTTLGAALGHKALALYDLGFSYEAIRQHLAELYQLDVSAASLSTITDQVLPLLERWRARPLQPVYPKRPTPCWAWIWRATKTCWASTAVSASVYASPSGDTER